MSGFLCGGFQILNIRPLSEVDGTVIPNIKLGRFIDDVRDEDVEVVIKFGDIRREREIFEALREKKRDLSVQSTGCVLMYRNPPALEYLVLEKFGNDIRSYFYPESTILISNVKNMLVAVASLHQLGFVHCDLKPANILVGIGPRGEYFFKLCDLECAKAIGEEIRPDQKITECWSSPELFFCCLHGIPFTAELTMDSFGIGLVIATFLGAGCRPDKTILPIQNRAELESMLQDQERLDNQLDCSRKPHYQDIVKLACRYCSVAKYMCH